MGILTVRLTELEELELQRLCDQYGKSKSKMVRELLVKFLRAQRLQQALQEAHAILGPAAQQSGWLTERDILRNVS